VFVFQDGIVMIVKQKFNYLILSALIFLVFAILRTLEVENNQIREFHFQFPNIWSSQAPIKPAFFRYFDQKLTE
jgi:hypothetical protein